MTTVNSLYDAPTREIYLLENVAIQGRKTELRQLLKLLNLAKTGQPKAALITGDAGIGKTALLETFMGLVQEGVYCRVLNLGKMTYASPEEVYVTLIEKLQDEANSILDDALVAVNEITQELDLRWERQDLVRAIALVKLQESIGGKGAVSQEQLVKAIRSQVPAVKKLKLSVNESIQKLVDLIVNPWVMVATSLLNPMSPPLQEALRLAEVLREQQCALAPEQTYSSLLEENPAAQPHRYDHPAGNKEPFAPLDENGLSEGVISTPRPVKSANATIEHELNVIVDETVRPLDAADFMPPAVVQQKHYSGSTGNYSHTRIETPAKPIKDPLIKHLMSLFNFINATLENIDSGLLLVVDEWDRIQDKPRQTELKEFFTELIFHITEQKNYHFMVVMAARTEGESYTLGGALYNHFRTKLLLDALNESACRKLIRTPLKEMGVDLDEEVNQQIMRLSRGNPFWHLKILSYLKERVEGNRIKHVDLDFFEKLGLDTISSLFELSFTRLKLTFLNDEESLYKVIASLIKQFGEESFSANQAIKEISASQGFTDGYVFEVLRALFRHDVIRQVSKKPDQQQSSGSGKDPHYAIQSRFILNFLMEQTQAIETDISTDEKLMYLKKVIPLSVKSGDLDREKTMEVIALGNAMGNPEIVAFLEDVFLEFMHDDKAVVRVTALNNMALIDSQKARESLFAAMRDDNSMVREYAAHNLALISQKHPDAHLASQIVEVMIQAIDDECEAVRSQVYSTLSRYRWHMDLVSVFVKGMSDACDDVRLTAIKNLADMETDSPYVFSSLMDALNDVVPEIRRYACIGLQRYPGPEAIDIMVKILQGDKDSALRALAADSLSHMEDAKAFAALVHALRREPSEDVKLAVVRALGKRRGWQTEAILLESLQNADWENMPVFVWACVRSIGQVGGSERARDLLLELRQKIVNPIILSAIEHAIRRLNERVQELRQMERQLEEATPLTVAIPSEYDEEVVLPEEELPHEVSHEREPMAATAEEAERDDVEESLILATKDGQELDLRFIANGNHSPSSSSGSTAGHSREATGGERLSNQSARAAALLKLPFER
ncbi:HEAT repeat domain-containing protein [Vampirovibrio sp.]|uniref:HEAT repeat domain-containing protein n=1 Tax=Vampirovibrio sp. TaxID=2717857 RepID=UPI0035946B05